MQFAHLKKEERFGLAVAAGLHVAILLALAINAARSPADVPVPERMVVSLADEISLTSTAPDPSTETQAAIAQTLSEDPAPAPDPQELVAEEQPRVPAPQARPTVTPEPQPTQPPQTRRSGGGSRIGDNFLQGSSSGDRSESRGSPAAEFGPSAQASLVSAISRQLRPHWNAPQGVDAEKLVTLLDWDMNKDGSLAGRPRLRGQDGITDANRPQAARHAELAIRAVQLAAPFDLPSEYYDEWKRIRKWRFDRNSSR